MKKFKDVVNGVIVTVNDETAKRLNDDRNYEAVQTVAKTAAAKPRKTAAKKATAPSSNKNNK